MTELLYMPCADYSCTEFGKDDLSRAADICVHHLAFNPVNTIPPPFIPKFMEGWEACTKVWAEWRESDAARKQREYEAEQARQLEFVNEIAKGLK